MQSLTRQVLCDMLPHGEDMCLLDSVQRWNSSEITCETRTHLCLDNPLRRDNLLESVCGIEYAAQAMALHVGLTTSSYDSSEVIGYLGAIKNTIFYVDRLDQCPERLEVHATRLITQRTNFMYGFHLTANGEDVLTGRASIFIQHKLSNP